MPDTIDSVSIRAWPLDFPSDITVQRRAPYEALADSVMYREVLAEVAHMHGWTLHVQDAKDVEAQGDHCAGRARQRRSAPPARGAGSAVDE